MLNIKRFVFIILSAMLVLTACSKDNKTQKKATPSASKVVDLGEDEETANQEDGDDKSAKKKPSSNRPAQANRDSKKKPPRPSAKKEDKPAEDAAAVAKDADPAKDTAKPDTAKKTDDAQAAAPAEDTKKDFDFSDDKASNEPTPRIVKKREGLDIENVITIRELREQTGYVGALTQTDLVGQASDPKYNVIRLSTDKSSELGFAVQVWKPGNESAASKRFEEIYKQSFGGVKQKDIATDAFLASHHSIKELGFYDKAKRAVVLISCSDSVCKADHLKNIATTIQRRL